jgi:peptidyl-prolyl cis-trans isomerase SurA
MRFVNTLLLQFALGLVIVGGMASAPLPVQAQGLFAPARKVNDRIITNHQVNQRILFLEVLNAGGADMRAEALDRLTEEAVQRDYARRNNIRVNRDELAEGVAEFAARVELTSDEFIAALAEAGIERETFIEFVEAGLLWRKVVGGRLPGLVHVGASDVARARDVAAIVGTTRVLMSEIFLPDDPEFAEPVAIISDMILNARSMEEFSEIAREFSLAGTRDQGGRLDWIQLDGLPGQIRDKMAQARIAEVIGPIDLGGAIAFFQLRARESTRDIPADRVKVNYRRLLLPGGRSEANLAQLAQIQARTQHCAGLDQFARNLPEAALTTRDEFQRNLPTSDAVELARLDRNGISANTIENGNLVVLMLCSRELERDENSLSDGQLSNVIFEQRLAAMADVKLQGLIADAEIRDY